MSSFFSSHGEDLMKSRLNITMLEREVNPIDVQIVVTPCTLVCTWMMLDWMYSHGKIAFKFKPAEKTIPCLSHIQQERSSVLTCITSGHCLASHKKLRNPNPFPACCPQTQLEGRCLVIKVMLITGFSSYLLLLATDRFA